MTRSRIAPAVCVAAALLAAGCRSSIVFTTSSLTGVELSTVESGTEGVRLGYSRAEGVTMPMRKVVGEDGKVRYEEAYSVLAALGLRSTGFSFASLGNFRVMQVFATGPAAEVDGAEQAMTASVQALAGKLLTTEVVDVGAEVIKIVRKHRTLATADAVYDTIRDVLGTRPADAAAANQIVNSTLNTDPAKVQTLLEALRTKGL